MKRRSALRQIVLAVLLILPISASAHHSFSAEFDESRTVHMQGKVAKVDWANPHVLIDFIVTDSSGKPTVWTIQASRIEVLLRNGWAKDTLKPDMTIRVEGFLPRKSVQVFGSASVTLVATGQVLKTPREWNFQKR